jgi:hypothetical protein
MRRFSAARAPSSKGGVRRSAWQGDLAAAQAHQSASQVWASTVMSSIMRRRNGLGLPDPSCSCLGRGHGNPSVPRHDASLPPSRCDRRTRSPKGSNPRAVRWRERAVFSIVLSQSAGRDETVQATAMVQDHPKCHNRLGSPIIQEPPKWAEHQGGCSAVGKSKAGNTSGHDEQSHLHRLCPHERAL